MKGLIFTTIAFYLLLPFISSSLTETSYDDILVACMEVLNNTFAEITNNTQLVSEECINNIKAKYDIDSPGSVYYFQKLLFAYLYAFLAIRPLLKTNSLFGKRIKMEFRHLLKLQKNLKTDMTAKLNCLNMIQFIRLKR